LLGYIHHDLPRFWVRLIVGKKYAGQLGTLDTIIVSYGFLQLNIFAFNLA
jgi:hypothetical protein